MKIHVVGTRGFPNIQGGVETHCEELYKRLMDFKDIHIRVYRRSPYVSTKAALDDLSRIEFVDVWAPKNKYFEAFVHTFFCMVKSILAGPDIIHFHNMGPGLFIPLAKLFGIKTVMTYHSQNYEHQKWNKFSRLILMMGELVSIKMSNTTIFVSGEMQKIMSKKYKIRSSVCIPNGVNPAVWVTSTRFIDSLHLQSRKYILAVGRITAEKGFDLLINAFSLLEQEEFKLVIAGGADLNSEYSRDILQRAEGNKKIVLTGFIKGELLSEVYSHAGLFVLPSYHEGLPIALLEAMSFNLDILASNIIANTEVGLEPDCYFESGNLENLRDSLKKKLFGLRDLSVNHYGPLLLKYNWDKSANETYTVYQALSET